MFVDTAKISLPPLPWRLADQQPQHLCLDVNSVKDISLNVFHQQSTSGALRQIGKKASKGPDKLGILPLSSRDNIFLSSGEMSISSSEQLKGLPRPWWRRKLSNLTGKNEDTRTREHRIFSFPSNIPTGRNDGKKREGQKKIQTAEVFRGKVQSQMNTIWPDGH